LNYYAGTSFVSLFKVSSISNLAAFAFFKCRCVVGLALKRSTMKKYGNVLNLIFVVQFSFFGFKKPIVN